MGGPVARGQLDPGRFARLDRSQRRHTPRALCSFPVLITARDDGDVARSADAIIEFAGQLREHFHCLTRHALVCYRTH